MNQRFLPEPQLVSQRYLRNYHLRLNLCPSEPLVIPADHSVQHSFIRIQPFVQQRLRESWLSGLITSSSLTLNIINIRLYLSLVQTVGTSQLCYCSFSRSPSMYSGTPTNGPEHGGTSGVPSTEKVTCHSTTHWPPLAAQRCWSQIKVSNVSPDTSQSQSRLWFHLFTATLITPLTFNYFILLYLFFTKSFLTALDLKCCKSLCIKACSKPLKLNEMYYK